MTNDNATLPILQQLIEDEAVGQLRRRDGLMAALGSEDGALKLFTRHRWFSRQCD